MSIEQQMKQLAINARHANQALIMLTTAEKNQILQSMANNLRQQADNILAENQKDLDKAKQDNLSDAIIDRLMLSPERIEAIAVGIEQIINIDDPIDDVLDSFEKENGLQINKVRVPIGTICMIYESRPNVTADVAVLTLKTSNAVILRGGKEAYFSNHAIYNALISASSDSPLPKNAIQLVETTDRQAVKALVQLDGLIDLVIPRGGEKLIQAVNELARVPVIKHHKGLCHIYVDKDADHAMAEAIIVNAKCQRPGVCNAVETVLLHQDIAKHFLPQLVDTLQKHNVECRADDKALKIMPSLIKATAEDWDTEYLDLILSIKIIDNIDAAIEHINQHGSHHSDAIISNDQKAQQLFTHAVDSATVYINASTRFTDGAEFGMGAEIGISTDKLHARGPMGLKELTTYKYIVQGSGQVRT